MSIFENIVDRDPVLLQQQALKVPPVLRLGNQVPLGHRVGTMAQLRRSEMISLKLVSGRCNLAEERTSQQQKTRIVLSAAPSAVTDSKVNMTGHDMRSHSI